MTTRCTIEDCAGALNVARKPKHGNRKTMYAGRVYASTLKASVAQELDLRQRAGDIRAWEPQHAPVRLVVNGRHICIYRVDFRVILADGTEQLVEVKDYATREWRIKRPLLEALRPDLALRVVRR